MKDRPFRDALMQGRFNLPDPPAPPPIRVVHEGGSPTVVVRASVAIIAAAVGFALGLLVMLAVIAGIRG